MAELLEKDVAYRIIGCAMSLHNTLGPGLREKTYENGLCVKFRHQEMKYSQQARYPVYCRNELVDEFVSDLIVEERVIIDTKTVETITDDHRGTMIDYLKITGLKVGVISNFRNRHPFGVGTDRFGSGTSRIVPFALISVTFAVVRPVWLPARRPASGTLAGGRLCRVRLIVSTFTTVIDLTRIPMYLYSGS
jgi:GxxExxY protein